MPDPYKNTDNTTAYASNRDKPWKSNGSEVDPNASLDVWLEEAGLNYDVKAVPALYEHNGVLRRVENRVQLIRSDTGNALSQVSENSYKVRQPREIMEFFRNLVASNNMQMEVVGAMQGGKKIFALAKSGEEREIVKGSGDLVSANVFLIESFDGSHATKARSGAERLYCLNQIETHGFRSGNSFTDRNAVKRKHSQEFIPEEVQFELAHMNENFAQFCDFAQDMAGFKMTEEMIQRYFARIYAPKVFGENVDNWQKAKKLDWEAEGVSSNQRNVVADVLNVVEDNLGHALQGATGTLWGALNAVTFYHDHEARTKGEKRWESAMIGAGNNTKNDAFKIAKEVISSR